MREQFYPNPWGRSTSGEIADLKKLTAEKTNQIVKDKFNLSQTVFTIAGKYDFGEVCKQIKRLFESDTKKTIETIKAGTKAGKYTHIHNDGAQVHIGLMTGTVEPGDEDYYNANNDPNPEG